MKKPFIYFLLGIALVFTVAAVRYPIYVAGITQILSGTSIATSDGTVTNTFSTAYSAAPNVVSVQVGLNTTATNILSITSSNFVTTTGKSGTTNRWIAFGNP